MKKTLYRILSILLLLVPLDALAQRMVTGTVSDSAGAPLPGALVATSDHKVSTVTDAQGHYSITVPEDGAVLEYSFLSFLSQRIMVGSRTVIDIRLLPDDMMLEDVVVIGYGTVRKEDLTGSVSSVKMADIADAPLLSVDQALQGRVAGMDVMNTSGEPGAATSIRIRGTRSITASNEPLIVVDGVMDAVSDLSDIPSGDIESISVLKDASSTAIYGSRGANGVIIVTTRKGTSDRTAVTARAEFGVSWLSKRLDLMDTSEFIRYRNDYRRGTKTEWTPAYDPADYANDTDWIGAITRVAPYQNYSVSANGKGGGIRWYASGSMADERGIVTDTGLRRFSGRINASKDFNKWLTVGLKMNTAYTRRDLNKATFSGSGYQNGAIYLAPVIGILDDTNPLVENGALINTPYASILYEDYYKTSWSDNNTVEVIVKPVKGLTLKSQDTARLTQSHTFHFWPNTLPKRRPEEGADGYKYELENLLLSSENTATYKTTFRKRHTEEGMAGFSASQYSLGATSVTAKGLVMDELKWNDLGGISSKENYTVKSDESRIVRESFFGRFNYNYNGAFYLTATLRADGASSFATNRKFGLFPSTALKWNLKKMPWMRNVFFIEELSLRAGAGRTGNDAIAAYRSLQAYQSYTNGYLFDGVQGMVYAPSRLANPDLSWEKTDQYNIALETSLFQDRLGIQAEAYASTTTDLLLNAPTALQTGYATRFENLGKTTNRGFELTVETRNIERRRFGWTTAFTLSHNSQMVEDIGKEDYVPSVKSPGAIQYMMYGYKAGYPLNALWGFRYGGVVHTVEEFTENLETKQYCYRQAYTAAAALGVPRYIDQDHDGVMTQDDLVYLGNADPDLYGGLQNNFTIGKLHLGIYFAWSLGGKIYNYSECFMGGGQRTNQYRYMLGAWTPDRWYSDIPRAGSSDVMLPSSNFVYDASYLRLKDLTLQYTFDLRGRAADLGKELTVGLSGSNLWLWSKYPGFDPDVSTESGDSTLRRVDLNAYPTSRKVVVSLQMKF